MILTLNLVWLGVGFCVLASREFAQARLPLGPRRALAWLLRTFGVLTLGLAFHRQSAELGNALAATTWLVTAMAVTSISALLSPLWPRSYAATLAIAALSAAFTLFRA